MTKVAWFLVLTLLVVSVTGIVPASIGSISTSFAILLAMSLLILAKKKRLAARLRPGEKLKMPKWQKIVLVSYVVLVLASIIVGYLTKQ